VKILVKVFWAKFDWGLPTTPKFTWPRLVSYLHYKQSHNKGMMPWMFTKLMLKSVWFCIYSKAYYWMMGEFSWSWTTVFHQYNWVHLGHTQMYNKVDKIKLTQTKYDLNDLDKQNDLACLQWHGRFIWCES